MLCLVNRDSVLHIQFEVVAIPCLDSRRWERKGKIGFDSA